VKVECKICGELFSRIPTHLSRHSISTKEYLNMYPSAVLFSEENRKNMSRDTSGSKNSMFGKRSKSNLGKKFSEEWKQNISKSRKEKRISKGKNNPMYGKKHSKETIDKMSEARSKQIAEGKHNKSFHKKGYFHSERLNKDIWYDSSYELEALKILEEDLLVVDFGRNKFRIPYVCNNIKRRTVPDFLVEYWDGKKKIIEVKPQRKIDQIEQERVKIKTIANYCMNNDLNYATWTEKSLGILEI
jgi:hypothetical protein